MSVQVQEALSLVYAWRQSPLFLLLTKMVTVMVSMNRALGNKEQSDYPIQLLN